MSPFYQGIASKFQ